MQKLTVSASRIRSLFENFSLIVVCTILSRISKIEISWNYLIFKIQTLSEIVDWHRFGSFTDLDHLPVWISFEKVTFNNP